MRPDTSIFLAHIQGTDFLAASDRGNWGIVNDDIVPGWPDVIVWVKAAPKTGAPDRYYFKFNLESYPSIAPTACPWDCVKNARLENALWPRGSKFVSRTFNFNWNLNALYAPCDRIAMAGHDAWRPLFPELWWQPSFTINTYLSFLHHLLNSSDYVNG